MAEGRWGTRGRALFYNLRSSLWFRPMLWVIGLGTLAFALIAVDQHWANTEARGVSMLFTGGVDGARTMLGAIGSAMLTVATLTFSIMMLAVVQSANAYSPRIMREYLSDTSNQHVLGILIGTYLYSLLVLRVVQGTAETRFVPSLSISMALILSLLSIGAFIYFIDHVAHSIQVSYIVDRIKQESEGVMGTLFPDGVGQPWAEEAPPALPEGPATIFRSLHSGYIETIEAGRVLEELARAGAVLRLECTVGDYIQPGMPIGTLWPEEAANEDIASALTEAVTLGKERTMVQDLLYGVRQISDIALRAISPSVNDPSTAVNCIDVLATLLVQMARRPAISPYRCDGEGALRLIARGPTFETMTELAFTQIRQYAATDIACTLRLLEVCREIGYVAVRDEERAVLWRHVGLVARSAERGFQAAWDRANINWRIERAAEVLGQDPRPILLKGADHAAIAQAMQDPF